MKAIPHISPSASRYARFAAYAALGPITGPLLAGVIRNWNKGHQILAGLYAVAIPLAYIALAVIAAWSASTAVT